MACDATQVAKITAADVRAALLLRYPAESHALMFEVAPRTGGGTGYADAVAVGLWASHGHRIEGFEIKTARSDWLSEMKQPQKSEPVMRYCNHWWLACTPGVAKVDELPDNWGLLELQTSGRLRARVQAKKLDPVPVTAGFFASLVRRGAQANNDVIAKVLERERRLLAEKVRDEERFRQTRDLSLKQQRAAAAVEKLEALKARTGIDFSDRKYDDKWFAAIDLLRELGSDFGSASLLRVREALLVAAKRIDESGLIPEGRDDV